METRLEKRGSRLALRIPKALASEAGLEEGRPVRLSLMEGKPAIDSVAEPMFSLDELLASVTTENLHGAAGTGPAAGGKAW